MAYIPIFWNKKPQVQQPTSPQPRLGGRRRRRRPAEDVRFSEFSAIGSLAYTNSFDVSANVFSANSLISQGYLLHREETPAISILTRTQETQTRSCLTYSENQEILATIQQGSILTSICEIRRHVPYEVLKDAVAVLLLARLNDYFFDEDK